MKYSLSRLFVVWLCLLSGAGGLAVSAEPVQKEHVEVELVSEVDSIQPGKPLWVALRLKHEEHWHSYWKNSGDSGLPTSMKWTLPEGFSAGPIEWPYPIQFMLEDLVGYGYEGEAMLLTKIDVPASAKPGTSVTLALATNWLVCKDVCIPGDAELKLTLPVTDAAPKPSKWAQAFTDTRAMLPLVNTDWKVQAAISGDNLVVRATQPSWFKGAIKTVKLFPETGLVIQSAAPQTLKPLPDGFTLEIKRDKTNPELPTALQGVLVSGDGWRGPESERALRFDVKVEKPEALNLTGATAPKTEPFSFAAMLIALGSAFIGGLILNLMPCVLPVLSIKILGFVKQAGEDKSKVFKHGLMFTLGVLVSFWVLAGLLLILRAGGEQLGWGFQLQNPKFIIGIASLLFLLGLNLFGVFELVVNVGGGGGSGYSGSFGNGALATLVATPCTAPFMGSALGIALAQPAYVSMLIFTSLGLGMSSPYILLSGFPALLKFVPKPGDWMTAFKQFMGFLMMATVVWLVWVFGQQVDMNGVAALLMGFVVMSIGAWIFGHWGSVFMPQRTRTVASVVALVFLIVGLGFAVTNAGGKPAAGAGSTEGGIAWEPFSPQRVDELRAAGKPVFIDFTAAWCLSCKVNEKVALGDAGVQEEFKKRGVAMLKADWTSRDETITRKLAEFGRSGVPLYVLYIPGAAQPDVFPEVITPSIVMDHLKKLN